MTLSSREIFPLTKQAGGEKREKDKNTRGGKLGKISLRGGFKGGRMEEWSCPIHKTPDEEEIGGWTGHLIF